LFKLVIWTDAIEQFILCSCTSNDNQLSVMVMILWCLCREIWSCFCINSWPNYRSYILSSLRICWYVIRNKFLNFVSFLYRIVELWKSYVFSCTNRYGRCWVPTVLQPE